MNQLTKICTKCFIEKPLTNDFFASDKSKTSGFLPSCKECKRIKDKQSYASRRAVKIKQAQDWYQKNGKLKQRYDAEYRKKNFEKLQISKAEYARRQLAANPEKVRAYGVRARLIRRSRIASNEVFAVSQKEILSLRNQPCFYCGAKTNIHLDHVIPVSRGGRHSIGNLVPACKSCNSKKSDRLIMEMRLGIFSPRYKKQDLRVRS
jgi:hypothetical protein